MSNRTNHRRGDKRRTEHGPRWESHNPGKGCNSTHVARARRGWKRILARQLRRQLNQLPGDQP
jgi:hypothetical protein